MVDLEGRHVSFFWTAAHGLAAYYAWLQANGGGGADASGQSGAGSGSAAAGAAGASQAGADAGARTDPAGDPDRIALYAGTYTGWRSWGVDSKGTLQSATASEIWPAGAALEMRCTPAAHTIPQADCSCGIYAFKTRQDLEGSEYAQMPVHGRVALWGRVIEHEHGYRAQRAYPAQLWVAAHLPIGVVDQLRTKYGVPIVGTFPAGGEWVEPPPAAPPLPNPHPVIIAGQHIRTLSRCIAAIAPIASTAYECRLPLGTGILQLELSKNADGLVKHVRLIKSDGQIITERPLDTLGRSSSGGFMVFDGLVMTRAQGTGGPPFYIDTRHLSSLSLRLDFAEFSHAPAPIWLCALELLIPPPHITRVAGGF
jgi:hypothetical protein